jgi:hypothetical protein
VCLKHTRHVTTCQLREDTHRPYKHGAHGWSDTPKCTTHTNACPLIASPLSTHYATMRCLKLLCPAACPIILTRHSAVAWLAAATHERLQHSSPCKFCTTHTRAPPMCTTLHLASALAASQRLSNSHACAPQPCSLPRCDVLCCAVTCCAALCRAVLCCQPHAGQHVFRCAYTRTCT